jgi:hypothetical protein
MHGAASKKVQPSRSEVIRGLAELGLKGRAKTIVRTLIAIGALAGFIEGAAAQALPEFDIQAHCGKIGGDASRVASCVAGENNARQWLESRRLDVQIVYQCTTMLPPDSGYLRFRACVLSKRQKQGQ